MYFDAFYGTPLFRKESGYMAAFDKEKVYLLQVYDTGSHVLTETVVPGDRVDRVIEEHKTIYPGFKKILIFDADTKDGICVIRP